MFFECDYSTRVVITLGRQKLSFNGLLAPESALYTSIALYINDTA